MNKIGLFVAILLGVLLTGVLIYQFYSWAIALRTTIEIGLRILGFYQ